MTEIRSIPLTPEQRCGLTVNCTGSCGSTRCPSRPAESGTRAYTSPERPFLWRTHPCDWDTCTAPRCVRSRARAADRAYTEFLFGKPVPRAFVHEPSPGVTWLTIAVFAALLAFVFVEVWFRFMGAVTR